MLKKYGGGYRVYSLVAIVLLCGLWFTSAIRRLICAIRCVNHTNEQK